jgi:hypothetical protein
MRVAYARRMHKLTALLALGTAAACGGSGDAPPDGALDAHAPDATAPDAEPPGANQIVFTAQNAAFLAYRNGAGRLANAQASRR